MPIISLGNLAKKFAETPAKLGIAVRKELSVVGSKVRDDATKKFGTYQPAVGDLPAWELLTIQTVDRKELAGGSGDGDPLIGHYPKGESNKVWGMPLRTTIESHIEDMEVVIGSKDPLAKWHEFGCTEAGKNHDTHIPPRPFLRPAAFQNEDFFLERMALAWEEAVRLM